MFQICQCGTQPGYAHAIDCPFPYFYDDTDGINKWKEARNYERRVRKLESEGITRSDAQAIVDAEDID